MTEHRCKSLRNNASQCPRRLRREMHNRARDLQAEFPGRNGFSAPNLWLMRQFFNEYRDKPNLQPLVREVSWSKNLLNMARCKDDLEREFYLRATARFGWSKSVLQHQLDNHSYRQYLLGQTNFDAVVPDSIKAQTEQIADIVQADGCTFSIKTVLPWMAAHLQYSQQGTVQNGGQAQRACLRCAPWRRNRTRPTHHQSRTPANRKGLAGVLRVGYGGYGGHHQNNHLKGKQNGQH